jgi:hypothetical protein
MALGRIHALRWSQDHHRSAKSHLDIIERELATATIGALNEAFLRGRLDLVRDLAPAIPTHLRTTKLRIKVATAQARIPGALVRSMIGR